MEISATQKGRARLGAYGYRGDRRPPDSAGLNGLSSQSALHRIKAKRAAWQRYSWVCWDASAGAATEGKDLLEQKTLKR